MYETTTTTELRDCLRHDTGTQQGILERLDLKAGIIIAIDGVVFTGLIGGVLASLTGVIFLPRSVLLVLAVAFALNITSASYAAWATLPYRGPTFSSPFRYADAKTADQLIAGYPLGHDQDRILADQAIYLATSGLTKSSRLVTATVLLIAAFYTLLAAVFMFGLLLW